MKIKKNFDIEIEVFPYGKSFGLDEEFKHCSLRCKRMNTINFTCYCDLSLIAGVKTQLLTTCIKDCKFTDKEHLTTEHDCYFPKRTEKCIELFGIPDND
jgi:hypothetical protein